MDVQECTCHGVIFCNPWNICMYVKSGRMFSPHSAKDVCADLKINNTNKVDSNSTSVANGTKEVDGKNNVQRKPFTTYFTIS